MIRLTVRDLWSRKLRTSLTALAIVLGVAMIAGTFILTDLISQGFKDIFSKGAVGTDVTITPKSAFTSASFAPSGTLPASMLDQVKAVDGVLEAVGTAQGIGAVVIDGKAVSTGGAPTLVFSTAPFRFSQSKYISGSAPAKDGTVAINSKLASDENLKVGDTIGLTTDNGLQQVQISGIFNFGDSTSIGGATLVATTLADAQRWYNLEGQYSTIAVAADPGVTPETLAPRIRAALPPTVDVKTAAQAAADSGKQISDAIGRILTPILLAFAGVAVLVGAFIIFNAFSITVAQRLREFAMLRSLGATRRQVLTMVIGEAAALGLVGSLLGILVGIGLAKLMLKAFASIPASGLILAPRTIIASLVVGIGVASLAALAPALRATRIPPVVALQEGASLPPSWLSRHARPAAAIVAVVGAVVAYIGMTGRQSTSMHLLLIALGAILIFVAIAMVARYVVRPLASVIGWPVAALFGTSGRLARDNASRNPQRTAATSAALMICLAVVVLFAILAQGFKDTFVTAIDRSLNASIVVSGTNGGAIPAKVLDAVRGAPGVDFAAGLYTSTAKINGGSTASAMGINPATFAPMWHFHWLKGGSDTLLGRLTGNQAIVEEQFANKYDAGPGKSFIAMSSAGNWQPFRVIGEYRDPTLMTGFTIAETTFDSLLPSTQHDPLYVIASTTNPDPAQVKAGIATALQAFPTTKVQTRTEYADSMKKNVNGLLTLIYALLGVSVVISVFGIVNALVLTVYERTREIGMLRAIGASRRQMRRIVRYESVITSVIGGILGMIVGVVFGYAVISRLGSFGLTFAVPWSQLVIFLIVAALVGVLAAVLPARRAARIDILEAIHYE
jgi:putative ABC transport system permease protein